jgi:hypothetical protein
LKIPERAEVGQLNHLAELGEVVDGGHGLLQSQGILLMHHLEEGIAHGAFVKSVVDVRHDFVPCRCRNWE